MFCEHQTSTRFPRYNLLPVWHTTKTQPKLEFAIYILIKTQPTLLLTLNLKLTLPQTQLQAKLSTATKQ